MNMHVRETIFFVIPNYDYFRSLDALRGSNIFLLLQKLRVHLYSSG